MITNGRIEPVDREFLFMLRESKSVVKRTFAEWLEQVLYIPSGLHAGERFTFDTQPVTRLWADCIDSGLWTEYVHTGPSQYGKSLLGYVAPLVYSLAELREHCVMGVPMADMAAAKWERDILPVLQASPELRSLIPTTGSGSAGGKIRDMVTLGNGVILKIMSAGGDDVNKAAFTSRIVAITEAARFSEGASSSVESNPYSQLQARQRSYPTALRRTYLEGTLTVEEELPWSLRENSTKSQILSPCPHCHAAILPTREHLKGWQEARSDKEARDKAYFVCPECEHKITERDRVASVRNCRIVHDGQTMTRKGKVTGKMPESLRLWFHVTGWHNLLLSPGDLAIDEWNAAQIPEDSPRKAEEEKKLCQFVWSKPYIPPRTEQIILDPRAISGRLLPIRKGTAPRNTMYLTTGVDMGSRLGWFVTLAICTDGTLHVVDYDSFEIHSEKFGVEAAMLLALRELRDVLAVGYRTEDGRQLPPRQVWVDAGYMPKPVLEFTRESQNGANGRNGWIMAAIGRGETQMEKTRYTAPKKSGNEVREVDRHGLFHVSYVIARRTWEITFDSDAFKCAVHSAILAELGKPGSITLPTESEKTLKRIINHWTNEQLVSQWDPKKGQVERWHKKGQNHLLDSTAMALGAAYRLGYSPMAMAPDETTQKILPEGTAAPKPNAKPTDQSKASSSWYGDDSEQD